MFETIFFMAELISVQPELQEEDLVITRSQIERLNGKLLKQLLLEHYPI
jgi:hypothetical protein